MKILFTTLNSKYIHSNLAIKYLSGCMEQVPVETREFTINEDMEEIYYQIIQGGYQIVAFSCYIWNIEMTLKIAENLKKTNPNQLIILGGPEVSYQVRDFLKCHPFIDMIVQGEGEEAFIELDHITGGYNKIAALVSEPLDFISCCKEKLKDIPNLFFRMGEEIFGQKEEILGESYVVKNLSVVPSPYQRATKESIDNRIVYYETSRGCTYNCSYCLSATSKGIRYFEEGRVFKELKSLVELGAHQIKFVDRTFNADPSRAFRLMDYLMQIDDGKINFHFEITAHLLQQDLLQLIQKARVGLFQFEIGVQSTNPKTLTAVKRGDNISLLLDNVKEIKGFQNIHLHLDLIAGLPYEDLERFKQSFNDVFDFQVSALQLGFLKLLKGSPIYEQIEKYQYEYRNYPPYEIIGNQFLSAKDLMELKQVEKMLDRFYNKGRYKHSMTYLYCFYPQNGYAMFKDLWEIVVEQGIDLTKKNEEFRGMYLITKKNPAVSQEILKELLRFDYLLMGRNPNVPDFLISNGIASKEEVFEILKEEKVKEALGFNQETAAKEMYKKIQWSNFSYDVIKYSLDQELVPKQQLLIINYDKDRRGDEPYKTLGRDYEIKH